MMSHKTINKPHKTLQSKCLIVLKRKCHKFQIQWKNQVFQCLLRLSRSPILDQGLDLLLRIRLSLGLSEFKQMIYQRIKLWHKSRRNSMKIWPKMKSKWIIKNFLKKMSNKNNRKTNSNKFLWLKNMLMLHLRWLILQNNIRRIYSINRKIYLNKKIKKTMLKKKVKNKIKILGKMIKMN